VMPPIEAIFRTPCGNVCPKAPSANDNNTRTGTSFRVMAGFSFGAKRKRDSAQLKYGDITTSL
jgi:hypothetical protein